MTYSKEIVKIHRQFQASLKRAKTRQQILKAYWVHKKRQELLLKKQLQKEYLEVRKQIKKIESGSTIPPRKK